MVSDERDTVLKCDHYELDVDKGEWGLAKVDICGQLHMGDGVRKCLNFVDVFYGWPLR